MLRSLLMFCCGSALLVCAALILEPSVLTAGDKPPEPTGGSQVIRDEFAESLSNLISNCIEILAINNHSATSQASIVLWMDDSVQPGVIDPQEVAVVSHSQLLRTITVYKLAETAARGSIGEPTSGLSGSTAGSLSGSPTGSLRAVRLSGPLDRTAVAAPVFCDRWRATPSVQPTTIATGISDMRIEPVAGRENEYALVRLWLRWSRDSADGPGEATALIAAASASKE